jgi:hypothetical protein
MLVAGLLTAPDGSGQKIVGIAGAHCGTLEQGAAAVRSIKAFGPPVMDQMGPIPYCMQNGLLDPAFPKGALSYWKAQFLTDLSDEAIRVLVDRFSVCPSPLSMMVVEHFHGAASRIAVADTACALRVNGFNVAIMSQWTGPQDTLRCTDWCRDTYSALGPFLAPMRYVNYLDHDEGSEPAAVVYGPNYPRLRQLKSKYDRDNFFHTNVNIRPL